MLPVEAAWAGTKTQFIFVMIWVYLGKLSFLYPYLPEFTRWISRGLTQVLEKKNTVAYKPYSTLFSDVISSLQMENVTWMTLISRVRLFIMCNDYQTLKQYLNWNSIWVLSKIFQEGCIPSGHIFISKLLTGNKKQSVKWRGKSYWKCRILNTWN